MREKKSEWSGKGSGKKENLTYSQVIANRFWPVAEAMFLLPLLHLLLGTANYQILKKLFPYLMTLQPSNKEIELKKEMLGLICDVDDFTCKDIDMEILVSKASISQTRYDLRLSMGKLERLRKNDRKKSDIMYLSQIGVAQRSVSILQLQLNNSLNELNSAKNTLKVRQNELKRKKDRIGELQSTLTTLQTDRKSSGGLDCAFERILKNHKIFFTPYHGRTLTGGAAKKLIDNVDSIMDELIVVAKDALRQTHLSKGTECVPREEEMLAVLEEHRQLLKAQDLVYSGLRKISPTNREMEQTRKALELMERLWSNMKFSKTPKAHLLFDHAADEQVRWGGLGDKIEDPLEKRHQDQINLYNVYKRIPDDRKQFSCQNKREWAFSDPTSQEILDKVNNNKKRQPREKTKRKRTNENIRVTQTSVVIGDEEGTERVRMVESKRVKKEGTREQQRRSLSA